MSRSAEVLSQFGGQVFADFCAYPPIRGQLLFAGQIGKASADAFRTATEAMSTLNKTAAEVMVRGSATACTDVTGFGLLGHACEMADGSGVTLSIDLNAVPLLAGVGGLVRQGLVPAGCYRNRDHFIKSLAIASASVCDDELIPLFDPQTSGGLLICIPPEQAVLFEREAADRGIYAVRIGRAVTRGECAVILA